MTQSIFGRRVLESMLMCGLMILGPCVAAGAPFDKEIDAIIKDEMVKQELVGAAVGVLKNGQIIHLKGYGHKTPKRENKITTKTRFRWASISKTVTAVAAFQLIEQGKIKLGDKAGKVCKYWPSKNKEGRVTLKHLLTNRSGVHHYGKDHNDKIKYTFSSALYSNQKGRYSAKKSVNSFQNKVSFEPGTKYHYTTFGFNLAGAMVDERAPRGYERWVLNKIAKPLGLTTLTAHSKSIGGFVKDCDGRLKSKTEGKVTWKLPGGGWASNIGDLTRFMKGLTDQSLLKNPEALWGSTGYSGTYRYGISRSGTGANAVVWHGGAHDDLRSLLYVRPAAKTGVAIFINGDYVSTSRIRRRIMKQLGYGNGNTDAPYHASLGDTCGSTYLGVWQKTGAHVIVRKGYSTGDFNVEWKRLLKAGYQPVDIEPYYKGTRLVWDGVFKKRAGKSAMVRNLSSDEFNTKWKALSKKGYRLIDVETYKIGLKRKWAGLFTAGSGNFALFRDQSTDEFGKKYDAFFKKGYRLIDVEAYKVGTRLKWAGVWVAGSQGLLNRNYKEKEFWSLVASRAKKGYRLVDVERYKVGGKTRFAGVWEKTSNKQRVAKGQKYSTFADTHKTNEGDGYELIDLERH